jgi:hypothetical protein
VALGSAPVGAHALGSAAASPHAGPSAPRRPPGQPPPAPYRAPGPDRAWVAKVLLAAPARATPAARAGVRGLIPAVSPWGTPTELLVLASRVGPEGRTWLRVLLDLRPNGTAVWLNAEDTLLRVDRWRIDVSVGERRVTVYRLGKLVRTFAAVVGKPATPTPTGLFAVAAELRQAHPKRFVGSWVLPLTAHSDVLKTFDGGDGQVALHGRGGASLRDPLGSARSHGCIRLDDSAIEWIATHVPIGTPVSVG